MTTLVRSFSTGSCCTLLKVATVLLAVSACNRPLNPAAQSRTTPTQPDATTTAQLSDDRWARFRSMRFGLSIPFPDGQSWQIDDRRSHWLVASHAASTSVLRARTWTEPTLMNPERCEQRAREWTTDIPRIDPTTVLDLRRIKDVPSSGFDTQLTAAVVETRPPRPTIAAVLAFGASMKKCFAMVYVTSVGDAHSAGDLGDRLGIAARMVEGTRFQSDLMPETRISPASNDQTPPSR